MNEKDWRTLSALLMDNGEQNPQPLHIPIGAEESIGLSSLDKLWTEYIFQDEKEGMIMAKVEGYDELLDVSEFSDDDIISIIYELIQIKDYSPIIID